MLKKFLCGVAVAATLTISAPAQAGELYVRNQPFSDHYLRMGSSYVSLDSFLKALGYSWDWRDGTLVVGSGPSPMPSNIETTIKVQMGDKVADLNATPRGDSVYVPVRELAEVLGYSVMHNNQTGVTDVVKSRLANASDSKIAQELRAAREAEDKERREALAQKRAEAAERQAARDAAGAPSSEEADEEGDEPATAAAPEPKVDSPAAPAEEEKPAPPPEALLEVLSTDADPNLYTGEVTITAVLQNQGYAAATDVRAELTVIGPDGRTWVNKTLYHPPMDPDERWEILEYYTHRERAAIPRGEYVVTVKPHFKSAQP